MDEFVDAVETFFDSYMRGKVHTVQPGIVDKVVSLKPPIVNVQPAFKRLREADDEAEPRPIIPNVPFVFPVFGDYGILGEIKVGVEVVLLSAERSIKTWMEQGGVVDPAVDHMFDLSDCIAIPGLPNKTTTWEVPDTGIQIGTVDGTKVVLIEDGDITIKTDDGVITTSADETVIQEGTDWAVQFTAMKTAFDNLKNELNALVTAYNAHIHVTTATIGAGPAVGVIAPTTSVGTPPAATMDSAKVDTVRLP